MNEVGLVKQSKPHMPVCVSHPFVQGKTPEIGNLQPDVSFQVGFKNRGFYHGIMIYSSNNDQE